MRPTFGEAAQLRNGAKRPIVEATDLAEGTFLRLRIDQTTARIETLPECFEILPILE